MLKCPKCGQGYPENEKFCPEDGAPLEPYILDGRYRLLSRIGDGGFGEVYAAEHTTIGKKVAIKLLRGAFAKLLEFRQRFEREAKATSRLSHLHCVQVTDFGVVEEGPFLVMEFLEGSPLSAQLSKGKLDKRRAVQISLQLLSALSHAHTQGIIHRDLKPDNVMLVNQAGAKGDFCKILDFGLAKIFRGGEEQKLTQAGMILGTPSYMSPEQATASESDNRSDIYSLGIILYEMLVGRRPFIAAAPDEMLRAHVFQAPTPPKNLNAGLSEALNAAVLKALEKKREDRFQSADEFAKALEATPEAQSEEAELAALMQAMQPTKALESKPAEPSAMLLQTKDIEIGGPSMLGGNSPTLQAAPLPIKKDPPKKSPPPIALVGVVGVLLLGVGLYAFSGKEDPKPQTSVLFTKTAPEASTAPTNQGPSERPTLTLEENRSTLAAEEALARKDLSTLGREIVKLKQREPKNARVYYLHGLYFYNTDKLVDALQELTVAVQLDGAYAYDQALLAAAAGAFETNFSRAEARAFFMKKLPRDIAIETLKESAANGSTVDIREGSAGTLRAMGAEGEIDYAAKGARDIAQAKYCKDKLDAVHEIQKSKDPKVLDTLKALDAEGTRAPINSCLKDEVKKAIASFGPN